MKRIRNFTVAAVITSMMIIAMPKTAKASTVTMCTTVWQTWTYCQEVEVGNTAGFWESMYIWCQQMALCP